MQPPVRPRRCVWRQDRSRRWPPAPMRLVSRSPQAAVVSQSRAGEARSSNLRGQSPVRQGAARKFVAGVSTHAVNQRPAAHESIDDRPTNPVSATESGALPRASDFLLLRSNASPSVTTWSLCSSVSAAIFGRSKAAAGDRPGVRRAAKSASFASARWIAPSRPTSFWISLRRALRSLHAHAAAQQSTVSTTRHRIVPLALERRRKGATRRACDPARRARTPQWIGPKRAANLSRTSSTRSGRRSGSIRASLVIDREPLRASVRPDVSSSRRFPQQTQPSAPPKRAAGE